MKKNIINNNQKTNNIWNKNKQKLIIIIIIMKTQPSIVVPELVTLDSSLTHVLQALTLSLTTVDS